MAKTLMSTVAKQIKFITGDVPHAWGKVAGTDIYPGSIVTKTGETIQTPTLDIPGAVDEVVFGVVGLLPNHDIDTVYTAGTMVPVHRKGSGDVVWIHATAGDGDKVEGSPLMHSHAGADGFALGGELVNEYAGQAYRGADVDATNDTPMLMLLR